MWWRSMIPADPTTNWLVRSMIQDDLSTKYWGWIYYLLWSRIQIIGIRSRIHIVGSVHMSASNPWFSWSDLWSIRTDIVRSCVTMDAHDSNATRVCTFTAKRSVKFRFLSWKLRIFDEIYLFCEFISKWRKKLTRYPKTKPSALLHKI